MPIQNCSLLKSIRITSDELEHGSYLIDSRFASSVCRSVIEENGRDVIWGQAEQEIELVLKLHIRRLLNTWINIKNVRIYWDWDEDQEENAYEQPFRRSDYRAAFLVSKEIENYKEINREENDFYGKSCRIDSGTPEGGYLVCRKLSLSDWDRLMVKLSIRDLPIVKQA